MNRLMVLVAMAGTALLAACGGGGGSGGSTTPAPVNSNFVLTAKVAGVAVSNFSVSPTTTGVIEIASSDELEITSTTPVNWAATTNGVTLTPTTIDTGTYKTTLFSPTDKAVTLLVTSTTDATKTATVTINVAAQRYNALPAVTNDSQTYSQVESFVGNPDQTINYKRTILSVNGDGTSSQDQVNTANSAVTRLFTLTATGDRLTRTDTSNNRLCVYQPSRELFTFPLYVGKTYSTTFETDCSINGTPVYSESATVTGEVQAFESVTVPAGTFDTLKLVYTISYTNSTDGNLTGGSSGDGAYNTTETCYWSPVVGRIVKCDSATTYVGATPPANYITGYAQELTTFNKQ